jgi:oligopeptide/dipeptide ABC transporter ATP-binding protein
MSLLEVDALAVQVGSQEILSQVKLSLEPGRCLGIVGETGSGKTMTARVLTGTLDRIGAEVLRGTARFADVELSTLGDRGWRALRGRRVALVPQGSLSSLDPVMSVGRQLTEAVRELGDVEDPRRAALELLDQVRMPRPEEVFRSYPHELSGGMRQRVMIALALAGEPDLLIADEPTTALDVTVQRQILLLLRSLQRERSMSLVIITHDLGVVEAITDTVAVMYAGTTVEVGPTEAVLADPRHPYTRALLAARPSAAGSGERLMDIQGHTPRPRDWPAGCRFAPRCAHAQPRCDAGLPQLALAGTEHWSACVRADEL